MTEIEELEKQQRELQAKIAKMKASANKRKNELGYYALQTLRSNIENIRLVLSTLDNIDDKTELEIQSALNQINKSSWNGIKAIERDTAERESYEK